AGRPVDEEEAVRHGGADDLAVELHARLDRGSEDRGAIDEDPALAWVEGREGRLDLGEFRTARAGAERQAEREHDDDGETTAQGHGGAHELLSAGGGS